MDNFIFLAFLLPDKQRKLFSAVKSIFYALYKLLSVFIIFVPQKKIMKNVHYHLKFGVGKIVYIFESSFFNAAFIYSKIQ